MNTTQVIQSQYMAALEMLKQVIVQCPAAVWAAPGDKEPTWKKAYHALFYTHLYLQKEEADFIPWEKHHDPEQGEPFSREEVLEYFLFVQSQVKLQAPTLKLDAPSGFEWLPMNKLELQFYNIRHLQQHTGELYERFDDHTIELDWVGIAPPQG